MRPKERRKVDKTICSGAGSARFRVAHWQNWPMRQTGHFSEVFRIGLFDVAVHTADFAPDSLRDPQKSMRDRPYYLSAVICGDVALSCRRILMSRVSPGRSSASSFEIAPCAASDPFLKIII
jgi:hypothetical protein